MAQRTPLFILTDLGSQRGQKFSDASQRLLLEEAEKHRWFPCVQNLSNCTKTTLTIDGPKTIVIDTEASDLPDDCDRLGINPRDISLLLTGSISICSEEIPELSPHPELTGSILADRLLRRGGEKFIILTSNSQPHHQLLHSAFTEELRYAGKEITSETVKLETTDNFDYEGWDSKTSIAALDNESWRIAKRKSDNVELADFPVSLDIPSSQIQRHAEHASRSMLTLLNRGKRNSSWLPVSPDTQSPRTTTPDTLTNEASEMIDARLSEIGLGPAIIAENLGVPRRTLERRFRNSLGNSLLQEIQRRKVLAAKCHLASQNNSSENTANACGFKDSRMMNLAFQRFLQMSPRSYLERFRHPIQI